MPTRRGLFDAELIKSGLFDPEMAQGVFDSDFLGPLGSASVVLAGSVLTALVETHLVTGGRTITLTLTGDTWIQN